MNISVYITSYNQKNYLKDAIESVLKQTVKPIEIIVVDDFSNDGSQELISQYTKEYPSIKPIFNSKNLGISKVRNIGLLNATGDYVTYLDGDDVYLSHKLEIESRIIQKEKCDVAFSNHMYVEPKDLNEVKWIWTSSDFNLSKKENLFIKTICRDFPRSTLYRNELVRRSLLERIGLYDENLEIYEDFDFKIRLAKIAKVKFSLEPTTKNRISRCGLSTKRKEVHRECLYYIFKKYLPEISRQDFKTSNYIKSRVNKILLDLGEEKSNLIFKEPKVSSFQKILRKLRN
ncbi:glycosyltransferase family 2 protein [Zunongwangia sp. H14]|uniref:glycosyltransferase family 2 protein n=1 Tax=Zunongwangia sp. H14 TaxID=3240792 RepID=UPI003566BDD3